MGPNPGELPNCRLDLPVSEGPPLPAPSPREITLKGPNGTVSSSLPLYLPPPILDFQFHVFETFSPGPVLLVCFFSLFSFFSFLYIHQNIFY